MVHHFSHQINVGHEDWSIALFKEETESLKTEFKSESLCRTHVVCKLLHSFSSFGFVATEFEWLNEKLQRRFLKDNGGVRRSFWLSGTWWSHLIRTTSTRKTKNNYTLSPFIILLLTFINTYPNKLNYLISVINYSVLCLWIKLALQKIPLEFQGYKRRIGNEIIRMLSWWLIVYNERIQDFKNYRARVQN